MAESYGKQVDRFVAYDKSTVEEKYLAIGSLLGEIAARTDISESYEYHTIVPDIHALKACLVAGQASPITRRQLKDYVNKTIFRIGQNSSKVEDPTRIERGNYLLSRVLGLDLDVQENKDFDGRWRALKGDEHIEWSKKNKKRYGLPSELEEYEKYARIHLNLLFYKSEPWKVVGADEHLENMLMAFGFNIPLLTEYLHEWREKELERAKKELSKPTEHPESSQTAKPEIAGSTEQPVPTQISPTITATTEPEETWGKETGEGNRDNDRETVTEGKVDVGQPSKAGEKATLRRYWLLPSIFFVVLATGLAVFIFKNGIPDDDPLPATTGPLRPRIKVSELFRSTDFVPVMLPASDERLFVVTGDVFFENALILEDTIPNGKMWIKLWLVNPTADRAFFPDALVIKPQSSYVTAGIEYTGIDYQGISSGLNFSLSCDQEAAMEWILESDGKALLPPGKSVYATLEVTGRGNCIKPFEILLEYHDQTGKSYTTQADRLYKIMGKSE